MITLLAVAALGSLTQEGREAVVKTYSLAGVRLTARPASSAAYGPFLPRPSSEPLTADPFFALGEDAPPSWGDVLDVLRAAAGAELDSGAFAIHGDQLAVSATPQQHACVAAVLSDLEQSVSTAVRVDARVYAVAGDAAGPAARSILTREEADALVKTLDESGPAAWTSTLEGLPGRVFGGGPARQIPYIAGYHCEIAKKAKIAEPIVATIEGGIRLTCQAFPSPRGGPIYLCALASSADVLSLTPFATRASDVGSLDIPRVQGIRLAATAHVPAGGALVLSGRHPEMGRFVAVLRPRWPGAVRRLGADGGAKPVVFLRAPGFLAAAGRQLPRLDASFTPWLPEPGPVSSGLELVKGTSALSRLTRTPTGFLFASGERGALDAFLERLAAADAAASRSLEIEVRVVKAATAEEALAPGAPVHESASLAAALHASAGAFLSHEESAVEGYQVLVAEEAAIATPDVKNLFRGLVVRARALDIGADATRAELEILRGDFGPRERSVSDATDVGDLERIPRRHTALQRVVELSANAPVVVGDLGLFGNARYFAVAAGRAVGP